MTESRTDSNRYLLAGVCGVLALMVLGLVGTAVYLFFPTPSGTSGGLEGDYKLSGSTPPAPTGWVSTSSSRFYLKHPPDLTAAKLSGIDRRSTKLSMNEDGRFEEGYALNWEDPHPATDVAFTNVRIGLGTHAKASAGAFYGDKRDYYERISQPGDPVKHNARMITNGNRDMLLVAAKSGSTLDSLTVYSVNDRGDYLRVRILVDGDSEELMDPDEARAVARSVRGP